ncbi:MAG: hypothetical protein ABWX96_16415, partial [Propionibacteriaceae bacterium]
TDAAPTVTYRLLTQRPHSYAVSEHVKTIRSLKTTSGRLAAVALAVVLVLLVSLTLYLTTGLRSDGRRAGPPAAPTPTTDPDDRPSGPLSPSTSATPRPPAPVRPPPGTVQTGSRYLAHYNARRIGWAEVISRGKPIPEVTARCADRWRTSGKDARLNWKSVHYLCLDALGGHGYKPQGIAGTATTTSYSIGSRPASDRNIVLTSWYSRAEVPGLFAPNRAGESVTRLVVMDLDQRRYAIVELVQPEGRDRFRNLNSHGSGLAWAGQYLYSSSHSKLWMYNADDLMQIGSRLVLPAVAKWTADGRGGLSSISLDRSTASHRLHSINYSRTGQAYLHSFDLNSNGLLANRGEGPGADLVLQNRFGEKGRVVRSARSSKVPGNSFQGVGKVGNYTFANSSGLRTPPGSRQRVDATVVLKRGNMIDAVRMPKGNGESVYIDSKRGTYLSMAEGGDQFFFVIPLRELIKTAERK